MKTLITSAILAITATTATAENWDAREAAARVAYALTVAELCDSVEPTVTMNVAMPILESMILEQLSSTEFSSIVTHQFNVADGAIANSGCEMAMLVANFSAGGKEPLLQAAK